MIDVLLKIADSCDGVRCDMAMLLLPRVFSSTWPGLNAPSFWPRAINNVRDFKPNFVFLGEVYWNLEFEMQQQV